LELWETGTFKKKLQEKIKTNPGKLKRPLYVEAHKESISKNIPSYKINLAGSPNSCLL
jgi:hypothetical protein